MLSPFVRFFIKNRLSKPTTDMEAKNAVLPILERDITRAITIIARAIRTSAFPWRSVSRKFRNF